MPFFSVFFFYVRFCLTYDFKMLINDGKYTWITQWRREQIERGGPRFIKNRYPRPPSGSHAYSLQTSSYLHFRLEKLTKH